MKLIMHNPNEINEKLDLAQKVSVIHARAIINYVNALSCTYEEKINLIDHIKTLYQDLHF